MDKITVEGLWQDGLPGSGFENFSEEGLQLLRSVFYSGVHSMLSTNEYAHKNCESKEAYIQLLEDLHAECAAAQVPEDVEPVADKKPCLKLVKNKPCNSPE